MPGKVAEGWTGPHNLETSTAEVSHVTHTWPGPCQAHAGRLERQGVPKRAGPRLPARRACALPGPAAQRSPTQPLDLLAADSERGRSSGLTRIGHSGQVKSGVFALASCRGPARADSDPTGPTRRHRLASAWARAARDMEPEDGELGGYLPAAGRAPHELRWSGAGVRGRAAGGASRRPSQRWTAIERTGGPGGPGSGKPDTEWRSRSRALVAHHRSHEPAAERLGARIGLGRLLKSTYRWTEQPGLRRSPDRLGRR